MSLLRSIAMMLIPLTVITAVHFYLYRRLFSRPGWNRRWSIFGRWSLFVLGASIPSSMLVLHFAPRSVGSLVAWPAMTWLGVLFFLLLILLPSELVVLVNWLYAQGTGAHFPARRRMLAQAVATVAGIGAVGASAVSIFGALRELAVKRVRVPLAKLPGALEGLRVVQVSDIHVGPTIGEGFVRAMVEKVNALTPDVIAITGDLVDGSVETLAEHVAPLADLRARYGVFFVTGNHEYIGDAEEWVEFLRSLGIRVLANEHEVVTHGGASLVIAGVHDWSSGQHDLASALAGIPDEAPTILLAHQPKHIDHAVEHEVTLQLSGHTHGGQIFPFNYLVRLTQPFMTGLHQHRGTAIYVSPGTGYWGPPMRLGVPAEITELELVVGARQLS